MQLAFYAPGTKYFIGRDSLKDTRESVLQTWRKLAKDLNFTAWNYSDNQIKYNNGSIIDFLDLSFYPQKDPNYDRFGSKEFTTGWIEEASSVNFKAFDILKTRVGRWMNEDFNIKSKILCTFNPAKTWVDTTFYQPFKNGNEKENIKFIPALFSDNEHLPKDYVNSLNSITDKATKERLMFGNFDYDDDPTSLITNDDIINIFDNDYVKEGTGYIVADIARFGSDKAVITVWSGLRLIDSKEYSKSSLTFLRDVIHGLRLKYDIQLNNVIVDEDGVGGGVKDMLKCKGFINGGKPFDKMYFNLKSECGYQLAKEIKNIWVQFPNETLKQELYQLKTYQTDKDGKLRILPKNKIKENIGRSPDWLDCMIMRMYFEVKPKKKHKPITNISQLI